MAEITFLSGEDTTPHLIRCAECHELVPADRVRHREERVKVAAGPRPGRWRSGGPPIFRANNTPRTLPSKPLGPPTAPLTPGSYALERVPVCIDCLRRQRMGLYGVCGIAAACVLAAAVLYSHREAAPSSQEVALQAAPPALSLSVSPPPTAPTPPADMPPHSAPTPPAAQAGDTVPQTPKPPTVTAEIRPSGPPIWQTEPARKVPKAAPASPSPTPRRASLSATAVALRNNGYAALAQRRYAEALTLLQKSTQMGDPYAPMYIGQLFETGVGVPRDVGQASYWYGIAIDRGNGSALVAFNRMRMNPY